MSLDVSLISSEHVAKKTTGIFIREDGATRELSIDEAKERYGEIGLTERRIETNEVFTANITHNLNKMAEAADLYMPIWCPEKIGISKASQLIAPLTKGLNEIMTNPDKYQVLNPSNGWGTYRQFVQFVKDYLNACKEYPDANVFADR